MNPHPAGGRRAPGFTAVEILVVLAIVAILAAVITPQVIGRIRESRQSALSQTFFGLSQGIAEYKKAVARYPSYLTLLTTTPVLNTATDACGNLLSQANIVNWRGPYVSRQLLSGGIPMGDAHIQNALRRVTSGSSVFLLMDAANVDTLIAIGLEAEFDGTPANAAGGTIQYTTAAVGPLPAAPPKTVNLSYSIPIAGC
ncbi:MAG: prepilin-type N-terminal cleavage/methylation domain-containing protein [Gemmatimonadaceae bacterium]